MGSKMVTDATLRKTDLFTKATGGTTCRTGTAWRSRSTGRSTRASLRTGKSQARAKCSGRMSPATRGIGRTTS